MSVGLPKNTRGIHNLVLFYPIGLAPRTHHPCIVHGNHNHKIYTFALDVIPVLNVAWKMSD